MKTLINWIEKMLINFFLKKMFKNEISTIPKDTVISRPVTVPKPLPKIIPLDKESVLINNMYEEIYNYVMNYKNNFKFDQYYKNGIKTDEFIISKNNKNLHIYSTSYWKMSRAEYDITYSIYFIDDDGNFNELMDFPKDKLKEMVNTLCILRNQKIEDQRQTKTINHLQNFIKD